MADVLEAIAEVAADNVEVAKAAIQTGQVGQVIPPDRIEATIHRNDVPDQRLLILRSI